MGFSQPFSVYFVIFGQKPAHDRKSGLLCWIVLIGWNTRNHADILKQIFIEVNILIALWVMVFSRPFSVYFVIFGQKPAHYRKPP